jgi:hypothetical protein
MLAHALLDSSSAPVGRPCPPQQPPPPPCCAALLQVKIYKKSAAEKLPSMKLWNASALPGASHEVRGAHYCWFVSRGRGIICPGVGSPQRVCGVFTEHTHTRWGDPTPGQMTTVHGWFVVRSGQSELGVIQTRGDL